MPKPKGKTNTGATATIPVRELIGGLLEDDALGKGWQGRTYESTVCPAKIIFSIYFFSLINLVIIIWSNSVSFVLIKYIFPFFILPPQNGGRIYIPICCLLVL